MNMCEANAYLYQDGEEELLLEDVDIMRPENGKFYLRSLTGEQKIIEADIREISLLNHKIVLEKK
jgi:predicted RNA-binding protein